MEQTTAGPRLNILALIATHNHHISQALAVREVLEAHGIAVDDTPGRKPSHLFLGEMYPEREGDRDLDAHLAELCAMSGIDYHPAYTEDRAEFPEMARADHIDKDQSA